MPPHTQHRRRLWLGALVLGLLGCLTAGALCAAGFLRGQEETRRQNARQDLERALEQSRGIAARYLQERQQIRQELQQRLDREAADLCANLQNFLQTALVREEARRAARENAALQAGREELEKLLHQQNDNAAKLAAALTSASSAITAITPLAPTTTLNPDGTITPAPEVAPAPAPSVSDEEKNRLLRERTVLQETLDKRLAQQRQQQEKDSGIAASPDETARLLRDCGADIESLLPDYASFTAAEAGGRVLLALGGEKAASAPNAIRAEAARNLLLPAGKENEHLLLRVVLNNRGAPAPASGGELARRLGEQLGLKKTLPAMAGLVLGAGAEAEVFPDGATLTPDQASTPDLWQTEAGQQSLCERAKAYAPAEWEIALQVTLPQQTLQERLLALAKENPAAVTGFITALLLLLVGIFVNAALAWRGTSGGTELDETLLAALAGNPATGIAPKPALGSLERLQASNRGRQGEGSHILDLAKSPVLRDLAARVRGGGKAARPSVRESRPALREYRQTPPQP